LLDSVQRFTKRIPGLATTTYYSRLKKINLESLELRRLRADLTLVYKILFGVIHTKSDKLFSLSYAATIILKINHDATAKPGKLVST